MPALPAPAPEMTQNPMNEASAPELAEQQSAATDKECESERMNMMIQEMQVRHLQSMASELGYVLTSKRAWKVVCKYVYI